ncbi:MAG: MFS transporter [Acidobacteria bacterium]|nr:MFS transporter [Acidobacteriota bacterium]
MPDPAGPWHRAITRQQWKTLLAAQLGWMLDAMDVMLYAFALDSIRAEFSLSSAQAGALVSVTLAASAIGGILFGVLADRIGRVAALMLSILLYSLATSLTATAGSVVQLAIWRLIVGLGMGGEWSAGSVLVSETWPAEHRGKAIGLMQSGWAVGYMVAAVLAAAILPRLGWRPLFLVGALPALITLWIRRNVPEPQLWRRPAQPAALALRRSASTLFRAPLLKTTALASLLTTCVLFAYWGLFTWIPAYLSRPPEMGGVGLSVVVSVAWIIPMQAGAFLGYSIFGFLSDRFGRRPVFIGFLLGAALLVPVYGGVARDRALLLALGPLIGFFGHGYFSVFGAMLAELFPTRVRGTAQGLTYNAGRALSAAAPATIGSLADRLGLGGALTLTSGFFLAGAAVMLLLPETRGRRLANGEPTLP